MRNLPRYVAKAGWILGLVISLAGCSTFNRDWTAARPPVAGSFAGRWEGKWLSDKNGHTGQLLCLLTRNNETNYQARFKATYWKIFRATYTVDFVGALQDGVWQFRGEQDLGWFAGGVYVYEGQIAPTNFFSTYRCKYDFGTFTLQRPE